jgi:DNA-binding transcriptional LysR family regulator
MDVHLRNLHYSFAVAEELLTPAAERLHISQPALRSVRMTDLVDEALVPRADHLDGVSP